MRSTRFSWLLRGYKVIRKSEYEPTVTKGELETQWGRTAKTKEQTLKLREERTELWRELRILGSIRRTLGLSAGGVER